MNQYSAVGWTVCADCAAEGGMRKCDAILTLTFFALHYKTQ